jgi:hypothetical protein
MLSWCTFIDSSQQVQEQPNWPVRQIWGFDSFEGLPEPSSDDVNEESDNTVHVQAGTIGDASLNGVTQMLESFKFSKGLMDNVHLVPGWFEDTLPSFSTKIALLHIDVDLHDSYLTVLNELYDQVVAGGVIAFDEYKSPWDVERFPGAAKAIDSFFEDKPGGIVKDSSVSKWYYVVPTAN